DPQLRAHDVGNLWIADSSTFPASAALNPALTIAALSLRLDDPERWAVEQKATVTAVLIAVGSSAPAKPWLPNLWLIRRAHHRGCSRRVRQISASTSADSFVGLVRGQRDRSARTVTLLAADVLRGGDTRWIHRAAHDLMGVNPDARKSMAGMPC